MQRCTNCDDKEKKDKKIRRKAGRVGGKEEKDIASDMAEGSPDAQACNLSYSRG